MHVEPAVGAQSFDRLANNRDRLDQQIALDRAAVDGKAFREIQEMRRRVAARSVAGGSQRRLDHRRYRALAVGACDVDGAKLPFGMSERFDDGADVVETEFDPELGEAEQPVEGVVIHYPCAAGSATGAIAAGAVRRRRWRRAHEAKRLGDRRFHLPPIDHEVEHPLLDEEL